MVEELPCEVQSLFMTKWRQIFEVFKAKKDIVIFFKAKKDIAFFFFLSSMH